MSVEQLVEQFIQWCARHRAPKTVAHYRDRLSSFVRKFGQSDFQSLTPLDVDNWQHEAGHWPSGHAKAGEPKAPDTIRSTIVTFERFQKWAVENKLVAQPITTGKMEKPRGRLRERIPTEAEVAAILKIAPKPFVLIYQGLRQCGARPNELCRATVAHWDQVNGQIVLTEHKTAKKTGKPRVICVGERFAEILRESLGTRTAGPLFVTEKGKAWTPARLSDMYRTLRNKAGLPGDLVLYLTRHEHATKLCQAGVNLFEVAQGLGHVDTKTTQRYLHTTPERLRNNQDKVA